MIEPIGGPRRLPQAGRIRIGAKDAKAKGGRRAINTFRFTSGDDELLRPVAERYGGEIRAWKEPKSGDRWELTTNADKINVILPPNPMTESYELWSGSKGLERRCDGELCELATEGPSGAELTEVPCICDRKGRLECTYKLRLSVMLPDVASIGTWRLDTSSDHARKEIPGVVQVIEMIDQGRGLFHAVLRLEQRTAPGKRFNVPVLDTGVNVEALLAGETRLDVLPSAPTGGHATPALGSGAAEVEARPPGLPSAAPSIDDEIIDGVVVDEAMPDPTALKMWVESLSAKDKNRALRCAREIAEEESLPVPTSLAACDDALLFYVWKELA